MSLKSRLDNHITNLSNDTNENSLDSEQISAVNLRRIRANLSPVNKTNEQRPLSLERPQPLARHSLGNKLSLNRNSNESIKQHETEIISSTSSAANKGPPPLPPKPKVLPTKPSNWGYNVTDQTTLQ